MTITELLESIHRVKVRTNRLVNDTMVGAYLSGFKGHGMVGVPRAFGLKQNALIIPMPCGNPDAESQRDSGSKPKVARNELPWENAPQTGNPNGVVARRRKRDTTPLGLKTFSCPTQGSSFLATLGWRTQSRWDCHQADFEVSPASHNFKPLEIERFGNCGEFAIIKSQTDETNLIGFNPVEFDGIKNSRRPHSAQLNA